MAKTKMGTCAKIMDFASLDELYLQRVILVQFWEVGLKFGDGRIVNTQASIDGCVFLVHSDFLDM